MSIFTRGRTVVVGVVVVPILVAILMQQWYQWSSLSTTMENGPSRSTIQSQQQQPPPLDYGNGSMFDKISHRYDLINRVLAIGMDLSWRQRMVETIRQSPLLNQNEDGSTTTTTKNANKTATRYILDVATGTADVALLLAQAIPNVHIVGVDPSQNMLHVGRTKIVQNGWTENNIQLYVHDAQNDFSILQQQQEQQQQPTTNVSTETTMSVSMFQYDAATMAFGIRNVPDREMALCQIHRVLKTDAQLCILEFSEPGSDAGWLGAMARLFIRYVVPLLGGVLSGQPREYWHLQNSIQAFPSPKEFGKLLESLDCDDGVYRLEELVQMNFGSVQLYVATVLRERTT